MLEIIGIIYMVYKIGNILKQKNLDGCLYQGFIVLLWITGEIIGAVLGVILTGGDESGRCISYIFALSGALLFSGMLLLYANNLPENKQKEEVNSLSPSNISGEKQKLEWRCPKCGSINPSTLNKCIICGYKNK
jgi:hypothetical protein